MYTVKELIDALSKCPEDYVIQVCADCTVFRLDAIGIDNVDHTVDLFAE